MTNETDTAQPRLEAALQALRQSADYLRGLPRDGQYTSEAWQFAVQNVDAAAGLSLPQQPAPPDAEVRAALSDILEAAENKEGDPGQDVIDIIVGIANRALHSQAAKSADRDLIELARWIDSAGGCVSEAEKQRFFYKALKFFSQAAKPLTVGEDAEKAALEADYERLVDLLDGLFPNTKAAAHFSALERLKDAALSHPAPAVPQAAVPDGWKLDDVRELHRDLVTSHISALLSPEKLPKEEWYTAAGFVRQACVNAANFLELLINENTK